MALSNARSTRRDVSNVRRLPRLSALGPCPGDDPLTLQVVCSTSPNLSSPTTHPVTIRPDWTLETPHDLDAERVATAFGGFSSCLVLADRVAPAVRALVQARARRAPPALARGTRGTWSVRARHKARCCRPTQKASDAAGHLRSVDHAAHAADASSALVRLVADGVMRAYATDPPWLLTESQLDDVRRCVRSRSGPVQLWDAGLHPTVVAAIHDEVVGEDGPTLPVALFMGVLARRPDLAWLADTLVTVDGARPDPTLAEWLAWTHTPLDRRERQVRSGWLLSGVPRAWITELSTAGYRPQDAVRLSRATGRSLVGVADMLMGWVACGCRPTVDDLVALHEAGIPAWYRPSAAALTRIRTELGADAQRFTCTDLGLLVAREGTVPGALARARIALAARPDHLTDSSRRSCA